MAFLVSATSGNFVSPICDYLAMGNFPLYSLLFLLFIIAVKFLHRTRTRFSNLPPSPPSLPILGHLYLLREPLHQCLFNLSQKYGPIFSLRLGSRLAVVVSSPSAVEECLTKNDIVFANRPHFWAGKYIGYNYTTIGLSPYGDHWRNLRKICKHELLSPNCLNMSSTIRRDEIRNLLQNLYHGSGHDDSFAKVELRPMFKELTFNIMMTMIFGKLHKSRNITKAKEERIQELIEELFQFGVSGYLGDFFPSLHWLDFQGYKKNVVRLSKETDAFLQDLIDQHRSSRKYGFGKDSTTINRLLSFQESQPEYYTDEIIKGLLQEMLTGGSDTTIVTLEWAMTNLLNNPSVLGKARAELDLYIGQDSLLAEADLPKLHYLRNVVSETLRLTPSVPLLAPHMNSENCTIGNYNIPKGTTLFVNAWAIHRDPKVWDEATSFKPERFENGGNGDYKMMPFGLGRRSCPGMDLGQRVTGLVLGLLIQLFEWERVDEKEISMAEGRGLTMPKAEPLVAMCKARHIANKLLFS